MCSAYYADFWVTLSQIASRYRLTDSSITEGDSFHDRLREAQKEVRRPTLAELVHVGLISFDIAFGSFVVFGGINIMNVAAVGIMPGLLLFASVYMMASSREKMLYELQSRAETEARSAVRTMFKVFFIHLVLVAKDIGWYFALTRLPKCPDHFPNPDPETNSSALHVTNVTRCFETSPDLFKEPLVETSPDALFYSGISNGEVWGHINGHFAIVVYLMACSFLYHVAKAQGVLHARLIDEWELERQHMAIVILWFVATLAVLSLASVSWAGTKDRRVTQLWGSKAMVSCDHCRLSRHSASRCVYVPLSVGVGYQLFLTNIVELYLMVQ
jgi:hypothetical protein